jgi:hypothetical protein
VTLLSKTHRAIATAESSTYRPRHPHACPVAAPALLFPFSLMSANRRMTPDYSRDRICAVPLPTFHQCVRQDPLLLEVNPVIRRLHRRLSVTSSWRRCSRMPTAPLSFAKPIFCLIVFSRRGIEPSRCGRTDRPPHSYELRIGKFHDTTTKFLTVESLGCHGRFYCGDSESESARSDPIENTASFSGKRRDYTCTLAVSLHRNS